MLIDILADKMMRIFDGETNSYEWDAKNSQRSARWTATIKRMVGKGPQDTQTGSEGVKRLTLT